MTLSSSPPVDVTILMPCLDEAKTVRICVEKARRFLLSEGIEGEVLVADNGSVDGSQSIAANAGARVINVEQRGYGAALLGGIHAARGRFVVMGDADDSYDFSQLGRFVQALREGADLVVGNRFRGGIAAGAMPLLHRYLGNPVLSYIGRRFFGGNLGDFHCGLRAFRRDSMLELRLVAPGMEFASEMIIKSLQAGHRIVEVPTALAKDGRGRPSHLNTWRDGWRHLRFLLLFSPRWLFLYPGAVIAAMGLLQVAACHLLDPSQTWWPLGIHAQMYAIAAAILGFLTVNFAMGTALARQWAGLDAPHPSEQWMRRLATSGWIPAAGAVALTAGIAMCLAVALDWGRSNFGALDPEVSMRVVIPGVGLLILGAQTLLASTFYAALQSAFESSRRTPAANPR